MGLSCDAPDGIATQLPIGVELYVAVDKERNLYITDTECGKIRKIDANGIMTTVAGNGDRDFEGDGGLAINAKLGNPRHITFDNIGNLYINDSGNYRIRKVDTNGIITTVAG